MNRAPPFIDPVSISSDESADEEDIGVESMQLCGSAIDITSEDAVFKKAKMYQDYMKQIPIPKLRGSVIPFNSWTELGESLKQLYNQPLHYLTNIWLKQLDEMRVDASDDEVDLDSVINPYKAEASIWLTEEIHRLSSSHKNLGKLWLDDKFYHLFIDPVFPVMQKPSS